MTDEQGELKPLRVDVITLLPAVFEAYWSESMLAREAGLLRCGAHQLREYAADKHHITDDYPYGGGVGMVMKPEPIFAAVEALRCPPEADCRETTVLLCPQGRRFEHPLA